MQTTRADFGVSSTIFKAFSALPQSFPPVEPPMRPPDKKGENEEKLIFALSSNARKYASPLTLYLILRTWPTCTSPDSRKTHLLHYWTLSSNPPRDKKTQLFLL